MNKWIVIDDDYGWNDDMDDEMHVIIEVECSACKCRAKFVPPVLWEELPGECPNCGEVMGVAE